MRFQTILLAVFGLVAVAAVIVFSAMPPKQPSALAGATGNAVIWGTFPKSSTGLMKMVNDFNSKYKDSFSISYEFHDPKDFDRDIVEALASGRGPDVLLLPDDLILRHTDKIEMIPYQSIPPASFSALFVQASEIYMRENGLIALPFAIDPMVMYWNRDLFNNASITEPPKYWDELISLTPRLTKRDPKSNDLTQSAVSFGEYANVEHAKDIIAMLFLQQGNKIVEYGNGRLSAKLSGSGLDGEKFAVDENIVSAFRFFMDFSNPIKSIYTWSRAKSTSQNEFINGNLAIYLDHASAYKVISEKNPHLNFAVTQMPMPRGTRVDVTFAKVHGLAVMKNSTNKQTALIAVQRMLLDPEPARDFALAFDLPPVRRDLLAQKPLDAVMSNFYDAAIRSRTWLDPKPELSDAAFQRMVESVSSGRIGITGAIGELNAQLTSALAVYN